MVALRVSRRVFLLALHLLVGLLITPLSLQRTATGALRIRRPIAIWWHNRAADILDLGITVEGPRPRAPALLASNHVSWLDIVVLGALVPTDFLSKYEVRRWLVIGWLAERAGTVFIRRGTGEAAGVSEQIAARLNNGDLLTLFPEGTTTDGRQVRPFFSRLFSAAKDTGTAVIPVTLRYHVDGEHDPIAPYIDDRPLIDSLRGLVRRERSQVHVVFGEPIEIGERTRKQIAEHSHAAVAGALNRPVGRLLSHATPGVASD